MTVECDTDENFKDDRGVFTVFPAIMLRFELRPNFCIQMYFFINTILIHVD
jgi:hypothetical protein